MYYGVGVVQKGVVGFSMYRYPNTEMFTQEEVKFMDVPVPYVSFIGTYLPTLST
jgi:hypothetical protein